MNNGVRLLQVPSRFRFLAVILVTLGVLLPSFRSDVSAVQDTGLVNDTTFVAVTGQTVTWSAPWTFDDGSLITGADVDMMFLHSGDATVVIGMGAFQPDEARSLVIGYLGGNTELLANIDSGSVGTSSYWLDTAPMNGTSFGSFAIAEVADPEEKNTTMTMVIAPTSGFADAVRLAQTGVAIDSAPLLSGVEGSGLQSALETAQPTTGSTPERASSQFVPIDSWVDPIFGVSVEWAEGWESAGVRDENTLMLMNPSIGLFVTLTPMQRQGMTPEDWAAWLSEPPPGVTDWSVEPPIVNPSNCIVQCSVDSMEMVNEVLFLDDQRTIVFVTVALATIDADAAVETYQATVRIAGRVPLEGWEGAAHAAPATPPTPAVTAPESSLSDAGLVAEGHYVSPQFGFEIRWTEPWTVATLVSPPVSSNSATQVDSLYLTQSDNKAVGVAFYSMPFPGIEIEQMVEFASSPETIAAAYGPEADLLLSTATADHGGIVLLDRSGLIPRIYEEEYILLNGTTMVTVGFSAPVSVVSTVLPSAQSITVDGVSIMSLFTVEEIVDAAM